MRFPSRPALPLLVALALSACGDNATNSDQSITADMTATQGDGPANNADASVTMDGPAMPLDASSSLDESLAMDGGAPDLAGDMASSVFPPDMTTFDLILVDAAKIVVCNLGNDPLPCMKDADCAAAGAYCDSVHKYCVCLTPNCTPGMDKTCNDNSAFNTFHGHCNAFSACDCLNGNQKNVQSGLCM